METKTQIKKRAQDNLLSGVQTAFEGIMSEYIDHEKTESERAEIMAEREILVAEMSRQMARIEKLFGYIPYSGQRGV